MEIKRNKQNGGLYTVVEKDGKYYYFDLTYLPYSRFNNVECMAFECDENGHVTDWGEVFVDFPESVSEENLRACVEKFMNE